MNVFRRQQNETSLSFSSAFKLEPRNCGHRPESAVAVSGANRGDCGRVFTGCRSRDGDIGEKPSFPPMSLYFRLKHSGFQRIISASDMRGCGRLGADIFPKSSEWQPGIVSNPIPSAVFPDENGGSHTHPSFLPAS